jgi:hypothetical protein
MSRVIERVVTTLRETFLPFAAIAAELRIIRELYELELASRVDSAGRPTPIYRVTESPSPSDTEVFFGEDLPKRPKSAIEDFGSDLILDEE